VVEERRGCDSGWPHAWLHGRGPRCSDRLGFDCTAEVSWASVSAGLAREPLAVALETGEAGGPARVCGSRSATWEEEEGGGEEERRKR
jgi:hypothetical protein